MVIYVIDIKDEMWILCMITNIQYLQHVVELLKICLRIEVMKSAEKLRKSMRLGKVYRREDLRSFSTAVDRDLKTLVAAREVKKLAGGLYYRPRKNRFGETPPDPQDLVRAFLKTDDFLLTSYNHYNQLGLGLTQVYNAYMVYNHKRSKA